MALITSDSLVAQPGARAVRLRLRDLRALPQAVSAFSASFSARRAPLVLRVSLPLPLLCFSAPIVPIVPSCWRWRWRWLRFQLRP